MEKTITAVHRQIMAMGSEVFEVGLFDPAAETEAVMLPRTWDTDALLRSLSWLRKENREGRNIYVRPRGEHNLSLVDDLTADAVAAMKRAGFSPAVVVQTSPRNYQAWLKHPEQLDKELSTAAARALADKFGGDLGAADWRHFGRLAGFTNRKPRHVDVMTGFYPFVKVIEAEGGVYKEAPPFLSAVKQALELRKAEDERRRHRLWATASRRRGSMRPIEAFRNNPKYAGDGTRIDLAYAIYALSCGATETEIRAAIASRDLSHKGNQKRQDEYVDRTVKKAAARLTTAEPDHGR